MNNGITSSAVITILYTLLIFLIAWHAHSRKEAGKSILGSPYIYTLSIAVYCTSWTFYGSIGKAAETGIDFLMIYLGPTLTVFLWFFVLRRIIRISKEHNITNIADFISLRYGRSIWLGTITTLLILLGIMPYIALQIKAVSTSFYLLSGFSSDTLIFANLSSEIKLPTGLFLTTILAVFSVIFGARRLLSSERHEGLIAAVAFESIVKLFSMLAAGIFITYGLFNGFTDIFTTFHESNPDAFNRLFTLNVSTGKEHIPAYTMLFMSMGAFMLLPRQFHVMVIENLDEQHINKAMWLFPAYMFLITLFVMPVAIAGLLMTGSSENSDFFLLSIPLLVGNENIAKLVFLGGLSAAGGMVMVESIAISTMLLNNIFVPLLVNLKPRTWFPLLLINLKRLGIFLVVFLGYFYYRTAGESMSLADTGFISFAASCQLLPAFTGALFWRHGNRIGAITGTLSGLLIWAYTLLLPSFRQFEWFQTKVLELGPFGLTLLKPETLFGLQGLDIWTHSLFWSLFFNAGSYILFSILLPQDELEKEQLKKFFTPADAERRQLQHADTKRLSKPVTINQFATLISKFLGEKEAQTAISNYLGDRNINFNGKISESELLNIKRFTEITLAGSVGAAAAGAIVDSFLSDLGSRMESVYNIFSTVKASLDQSRESLYVRLKASEIINRTLDIQIIMNDLLVLITKEFGFEHAHIQLKNATGTLEVKCYFENQQPALLNNGWFEDSLVYSDMVINDSKTHYVNDCKFAGENIDLSRTLEAGIISFAHIPIHRKGEPPIGVLSVYSKSLTGLYTEEFIDLLSSLAGQLAQAVIIANEIENREQERIQKEQALLINASVKKEMEIAQQIQISLLPFYAPAVPGIEIDGRCISASHVGGDYYDFYLRGHDSIDILIADVSGHSVGAALIMSEVRTLVRHSIAASSTASGILDTLNRQLYVDLTRVELFISIFYARYNYHTNTLTYANAGHNPPLIYRDQDASIIELDADGLIIGVKQDVIFHELEIELCSGDVIVFYTDGLVEASNDLNELFGTDRIIDCIKRYRQLPAPQIIDALYTEIRAFTQQEALQDDISIIIIKVI